MSFLPVDLLDIDLTVLQHFRIDEEMEQGLKEAMKVIKYLQISE